MSAQVAKVLYRGHRLHVDAVVAKLDEEIRLFESRFDILSRMTLPGGEHLRNTYREMIDVRRRIRDDLLRMR